MRSPRRLQGADPPPLDVEGLRAYPPGWRVVAATLFAVSRASLPAMLVAILVERNPPVTPPVLFRSVVLFALFPGIGAWLVERALAARVAIGDGRLALSRLGLRMEATASAIVRVVPWRVPLPGPGFSLVLMDGRRVRQGLGARDPLPLLEALAERAGVGAARVAAAHPTTVYAHAKAGAGPWRWHHLVGKFVLFALAPTAELFNAHQHIAYGGLFGEYYLVGPAAYFRTFAIHWATVIIQLVLYASVWRGLGEGVALGAAWIAPSRAARVRRAVELSCRALYYGGVPVLLGLRFAPW